LPNTLPGAPLSLLCSSSTLDLNHQAQERQMTDAAVNLARFDSVLRAMMTGRKEYQMRGTAQPRLVAHWCVHLQRTNDPGARHPRESCEMHEGRSLRGQGVTGLLNGRAWLLVLAACCLLLAAAAAACWGGRGAAAMTTMGTVPSPSCFQRQPCSVRQSQAGPGEPGQWLDQKSFPSSRRTPCSSSCIFS
jgi:hypothetical protein